MSKTFNYRWVKTKTPSAAYSDVTWLQKNQRQGLGFQPSVPGELKMPASISIVEADNVILVEIVTPGAFFTQDGAQDLLDANIFRLADPLRLADTTVIKRLMIYTAAPKYVLIKERFSL